MPIVDRAETASPNIGLVSHAAMMLQERAGLDAVLKVVEEVGVPHPFDVDAATRISLYSEAAFVETACKAVGDIDFGFTAGLALHHGTTLPGYISEHSKTLRDALNDATRLLPLVRPGMDFVLDESGNVGTLRLTLSDPALAAFPRHVEFIYAGVIGQIRAFTARPFHPEHLSFRHGRATVTASTRSSIGCQVRFGDEETEMLMDTRVLDRAIRGRDDALRGLLVDHGETLQSQVEQQGLSFPEQVELIIQKAFPETVPSIDTVASALGVSPRSLSRRLRENGTGFSDILSRVRVTIAARELHDTDRQISDIAYRLGYTSQASFATAFRKATGKSPSMFRRQ